MIYVNIASAYFKRKSGNLSCIIPPLPPCCVVNTCKLRVYKDKEATNGILLFYYYNFEMYSHLVVTACLFPLCLVHGKAVTTVEGLGDVRSGLHAVQVRPE